MTIQFVNFRNDLTFQAFEWINGGALGPITNLVEEAKERLKKEQGYDPSWLDSDLPEEELGYILEDKADGAWRTCESGLGEGNRPC